MVIAQARKILNSTIGVLDITRHQRKLQRQGTTWPKYQTPLWRYAPVLLDNFETYLENKIKHAKEKGEKLGIFDLGAGDLQQWTKFIQKHHSHINFYATTLDAPSEDFKKLIQKHPTTITILKKRADQIPPQLPHEIHIAVTHQGAHYQEQLAIDKLYQLIHQNGEVIAHGEGRTPKYKHLNAELLADHTSLRPKDWALHLRKT